MLYKHNESRGGAAQKHSLRLPDVRWSRQQAKGDHATTYSSPPSSARNPMEGFEMSSHTISMDGLRDCIILRKVRSQAGREKGRGALTGARREKSLNN